MLIVAIRGGASDGLARGLRYTKLSLASFPLLSLIWVCACMRHASVSFMNSLRVSASYLFILYYPLHFIIFYIFFPGGASCIFFIFSLFLSCSCFLCSRWSFVYIPEFFSSPADHVQYSTVPDWQPRILLGMVETRSVSLKNTHRRQGRIAGLCSI